MDFLLMVYLGPLSAGQIIQHLKNAWRYTCAPPACHCDVVLNYAQGQFYVYQTFLRIHECPFSR
jgi:hypothetical protein